MPRHKGTLRSSFGHALDGLRWAIATQRNMRIHIAATVAVFALAVLVRLSADEMAILALTCSTVICAEMINTVIEAAVDLASPAYHPLAKVAKDVAAGAVLMSAIGAAVVGALLFVPHFLHRAG